MDSGTLEAKTVPGWLLMVMVVAVAAIACLAAYLLLRP
jgi:negative regulator of sigma E activity